MLARAVPQHTRGLLHDQIMAVAKQSLECVRENIPWTHSYSVADLVGLSKFKQCTSAYACHLELASVYIWAALVSPIVELEAPVLCTTALQW